MTARTSSMRRGRQPHSASSCSSHTWAPWSQGLWGSLLWPCCVTLWWGSPCWRSASGPTPNTLESTEKWAEPLTVWLRRCGNRWVVLVFLIYSVFCYVIFIPSFSASSALLFSFSPSSVPLSPTSSCSYNLSSSHNVSLFLINFKPSFIFCCV